RCPPGRSRRRSGRGRGPAQGLVPPAPRPRTVDDGAARRRAHLGRHDHRRVHPGRRGPDRGARGGSQRRDHARGIGAARRAPAGAAAPRRPRGQPVRITKLTVRDFRRYREFEVPLAPGLTIVHGPNEAGKTTIQRARELVLTKKATAGGQEMDGFRSWDAPEDARPVISIGFEVEDDDNGGGTHPGSIEKSFQGQRGTVRLEYEGQVITDPTLADQALAELTGIPTEAFFRSTASIRHHELADLDRDEATLRDRLQASISGADRGTSRAKKRLERAI